MDYMAGIGEQARTTYVDTERRAAPRYVSLIRSAKLVCGQGEFACVVRDVSSTGLSLRCFHALPTDPALALELQNGESFEIELVRCEGHAGSYRFKEKVPVERLVHETWNHARRPLRLNIAIPLTLSTATGTFLATTLNLSQQGARIECDGVFAIDQNVTVAGEGFDQIRAKIRWRRDASYGLVFEDTFSLRQFALIAAAVQCPLLLQQED